MSGASAAESVVRDANVELPAPDTSRTSSPAQFTEHNNPSPPGHTADASQTSSQNDDGSEVHRAPHDMSGRSLTSRQVHENPTSDDAASGDGHQHQVSAEPDLIEGQGVPPDAASDTFAQPLRQDTQNYVPRRPWATRSSQKPRRARHHQEAQAVDQYLGSVRRNFAALPDGLHYLSSGRRNFEGRFACIDFLPSSDPLLTLEQNLLTWRPTLPDFMHAIKTSVDPACVMRVVLVESACEDTLELLGQTFKMHPYFFIEHLRGAGYNDSKQVDPLTSELRRDSNYKLWPSLSWKKPVIPLDARFNWRQDKLLNGGRTKGFCPEPEQCQASEKTHLLRLDQNIVRSYSRLSLDTRNTKGSAKPLLAWEEKATCWTMESQGCEFVVFLLDPIPHTIIEAVEVVTLEARRAGSTSSSAVRLPEGYSIEERAPTYTDLWSSICGIFRGPSVLVRKTRRTDSLLVHHAGADTAAPGDVLKGEIHFSHHEPLFQSPSQRNRSQNISAILPSQEEVWDWRESTRKPSSTFEDMKATLLVLRRLEDFDPVRVLVKSFHRSVMAYLDEVNITLSDMRRTIPDTEAVQDRILQWRSLLTRFRSDMTSISEELSTFIDQTHASSYATHRLNLRLPGIVPPETLHLAEQVQTRIRKTMDAIDRSYSEIQSEITIIDSHKSIAEAESVAKLTELAFIFIPVTFASGLFSMQIQELQNPAPAYTFVLTAIGFVLLAYSARLSLRSHRFEHIRDSIILSARSDMALRDGQHIATHKFFIWAAPRVGLALLKGFTTVYLWIVEYARWWLLLCAVTALASPIIWIWTTGVDRGFAAVITIILVSLNLTICYFIVKPWMEEANERVGLRRPKAGGEWELVGLDFIDAEEPVTEPAVA